MDKTNYVSSVTRWGWLGFNCGSTFGISGWKWILAARYFSYIVLFDKKKLTKHPYMHQSNNNNNNNNICLLILFNKCVLQAGLMAILVNHR